MSEYIRRDDYNRAHALIGIWIKAFGMGIDTYANMKKFITRQPMSEALKEAFADECRNVWDIIQLFRSKVFEAIIRAPELKPLAIRVALHTEELRRDLLRTYAYAARRPLDLVIQQPNAGTDAFRFPDDIM